MKKTYTPLQWPSLDRGVTVPLHKRDRDCDCDCYRYRYRYRERECDRDRYPNRYRYRYRDIYRYHVCERKVMRS